MTILITSYILKIFFKFNFFEKVKLESTIQKLESTISTIQKKSYIFWIVLIDKYVFQHFCFGFLSLLLSYYCMISSIKTSFNASKNIHTVFTALIYEWKNNINIFHYLKYWLIHRKLRNTTAFQNCIWYINWIIFLKFFLFKGTIIHWKSVRNVNSIFYQCFSILYFIGVNLF